MTFNTSEEDLHRIFGKYGKIFDVYAPWDDMHNRHRGFGFVRFRYATDTYAAIGILHVKHVDGRILTVALANSRKASSPPKSQDAPNSSQNPKTDFQNQTSAAGRNMASHPSV
ncbi:serine/arginine-rich splicing factor SC35-like [Magnolia sinica]|uniref:serine/arginine-rich splicing factor SC35-like n=1 Tax=Magnolia sinica TaxID=86752 RepID=UPI00265815B8|nr:serine/arginine-rich splicing factor SC35-like [Magnolia sinica]